LEQVRRVGRERPGAFLLTAALAGVVAGRLTRGVVATHTDDSDTDTDRDDADQPKLSVQNVSLSGQHASDTGHGTDGRSGS